MVQPRLRLDVRCLERAVRDLEIDRLERIVVVSGWDDKRFEKSAEESGAYRFMSKDIMRTLLPEIAHEVCG